MCNDQNGVVKATNKCEDLHANDVVSFTIEIALVTCPENPTERKSTFEIFPVGLNESLTVEVDILCDCECERDAKPGNSIECHNHGQYKCGLCECEKDYFGRSCECLK